MLAIVFVAFVLAATATCDAVRSDANRVVRFDAIKAWPKAAPLDRDYFNGAQASLAQASAFYAREAGLKISFANKPRVKIVDFPCWVSDVAYDPIYIVRRVQTIPRRGDPNPVVVVLPDCSTFPYKGSTIGSAIWVQRSKAESVDSSAFVFAHEMGHVLGLPDAWAYGRPYANPYSIMGAYKGSPRDARLTLPERDALSAVEIRTVPSSSRNVATSESFKTFAENAWWFAEFTPDRALRLYRGFELVGEFRDGANATRNGVYAEFVDGTLRVF